VSSTTQHKESGSLYLPAEYAAIVIRPDVDEPAVLRLGDAGSLDELVHQCQAAMRAGEPSAELLKKLHYQIWAPLDEHIGDAGRVYVSPDGELSFVSFAALLRPDGTYLCEHHEIGYVSSGRDLLIRPTQGETGTPVLFGDPAFGDIQGAGDYLDRGVAFRSTLGTQDRAVLSGIRFPPLPGTQREVEALKVVLKASKQDPVAYLGMEATESRLKALLRPGLLHLATHGFFLPDTESGSDSGGGSRPSLDDSGPMAGTVRDENPMLRSGLALTGAALAAVEREGANASDTEDGIVTAEEISSLDLSSTRMVVLSACDTGVGEARAGQGVMGLRRAFAHAGARNLVMTLWPVQDDATVSLMVAFYERYLEKGDAIGALSHLQRTSITQAREAGEVPDPRVWGPFLISVQGR
jgi:CHAT domain-containing protein